MMRLGRTIIMGGFVSISTLVAPIQAQIFDTTVQATPVPSDDRFEEPQSKRALTPKMQPQQEVPALVRPRGNAGFGTRGRSGRAEGKTDTFPGVDEAMGRNDFSYGTVISGTFQPGKRVRMRTVVRQVTELVPVEVPEEEEKEAQQLRELIKKLRETKEDDEEQRTALTKSIQAIFNTQFERDLKQREDALAPLEARVKALRKQLDKRKTAQGEIIDLRLKMIVNEIDGLTFPGEEGNVEDTMVPARRTINGDRIRLGTPDTYEPKLVPLQEPEGNLQPSIPDNPLNPEPYDSRNT